MSSKKNNRINELDLLRLFAALSVVLFHYCFRGYAADNLSIMPYPLLQPVAKYGYLGVELFFMISGFVILLTAATGSLSRFVISRFVRLYPAFWICCTITFIAISTLGGARFSASVGQYLANMTMLSGFMHVPSIDGVYWSLFVELRFYLLVAVVLMVGRIHQAKMFLIAWLIAAVALEIIPVYKLRVIFDAAYAAYFIAGAMYYLVWTEGLSASKLTVIVSCWILALYQAIGDELPGLERHYHASLNPYVVGGLITACFAIMALIATRRTGAWGRKRWVLAGAVTYPLYLIHQNIGYMIFDAGYPIISSHILLWGTVLLMLGVSFWVHRMEWRMSPLLKAGLVHAVEEAARLKFRDKLLLKRPRSAVADTRDPGHLD